MDDLSVLDKGIDRIEVASMNFDQWILTIALRTYSSNDDVLGMVHVVFKTVTGFRCLDEGDMLQFPFDELDMPRYVHEISNDGWLEQEKTYGNAVIADYKEYFVCTDSECVCVLACEEPVILKELRPIS